MAKQLLEIGEREAIEHIRKILDQGDFPLGLTDDCAAIEMGKNYLLVSTDMINERTHMPVGMTAYDMGWHVIAVNLSDIASKGGEPLGVEVAVGLPRQKDIEFLEDMAQGMDSCARKYGTAIAGGDTKECYEVTLVGTAFGIVPKTKIMLRGGAHEGDIVAVTGNLGKGAVGYHALKHGLDIESAVSKMFRPEPRMAEGVALSKSGLATSCMDVSDGLASTAYQMCDESGMSMEIDFDKLPRTEEISQIDFIPKDELLLYFGGDYELLVTLKPSGLKKAQSAVKKAGGELTEIGIVTESQEANKLIKGGEMEILENRGYEHFR
ncbi:MAG: thiamine-phosphate kinase [Thermoplasmata archaeon]|nr:thiamine-phosphate kinase [Thermoplasmata archaeon]